MKTAKGPNRACIIAKEAVWPAISGKTYQCEIRLIPEEGGFSVYVPSLPGVVSQGDSEQDAIRNCHDALRGVLETYVKLGDEIPWVKDNTEAAPGEKRRWITVDV